MRVLLLDNDGNSCSAPFPVDGTMREHRIPLSSFEPDRCMMLPKAYPSVMKIWYETGVEGIFWWEPASRCGRDYFDENCNALPVINVFDKYKRGKTGEDDTPE